MHPDPASALALERTLIYALVPTQRQMHRSLTRLFSIAMIVVGVALLVRTLSTGGGPIATGVLLGALFVIAGIARLYLQYRGR